MPSNQQIVDDTRIIVHLYKENPNGNIEGKFAFVISTGRQHSNNNTLFIRVYHFLKANHNHRKILRTHSTGSLKIHLDGHSGISTYIKERFCITNILQMASLEYF